MNVYSSVTELIGKTPLLDVRRYAERAGASATILVKLEYLNPAGSVKDRAAKAMIDDALFRGVLKKGGTIIEPTSGNTGIGLACIAAAEGFELVCTMPETMSEERRNILKAYGAEIVLTDGSKGMRGAIEKANELASLRGGVVMGQFDNPANPRAHYTTTGPEIYADTDGKADIFVAGVGTGGTITGAGNYLKSKIPNIKIIAVEPIDSPVLSKGKSGAHGIQGIGAGFVPSALDTSVYDRVIAVSDDDAIKTAKLLAKTEGVLAGISSGAALFAATVLAKEQENAGRTIVAILPDSADRYYSTKLFA